MSVPTVDDLLISHTDTKVKEVNSVEKTIHYY